MNITVDKRDLLAILRENKARHRAVFEAAMEGYKREALKRLEDTMEALRNGKLPDLWISLPRPEDHTRDYARVIRMTEMHTDSLFTLSEAHFAQYVEDDWAWKRQFIKTSSTYAANATVANYGADALDEDD